MNFLHLERVICIIPYSDRLYEPPTPKTDEYGVRDDAYHPFKVQEVHRDYE
jgi:hypothetical protein